MVGIVMLEKHIHLQVINQKKEKKYILLKMDMQFLLEGLFQKLNVLRKMALKNF